MEGFDIRTLAYTSLILSLLLGIGSFIFARVHSSFQSFNQLSLGYFLLAAGFVLIGLRQNIPNFYSIVIANILIVYGFTKIYLGILEFLHFDKSKFLYCSYSLIVVMFFAFVYFTYYQENVNARIVIISAIVSGQSLYVSFKAFSYRDTINQIFSRLLSYSCFFCASIFLLRLVVAVNEGAIDDYMRAGMAHAFSFYAVNLFIVTSCLTLSWSASQRLVTELATQATIDALTNVYNRRAFEEFATKEIIRAKREDTTLSVILMDIDFFKQVNDNNGHLAGDKVLQEFSQRLKDNLRPYDILARYGGEEFMLLLPDTESETAMLIAEKLRQIIKEPVFDISSLKKLDVTASFGVASEHAQNLTWQALVADADKALYMAKNNGRDQVQLYMETLAVFVNHK